MERLWPTSRRLPNHRSPRLHCDRGNPDPDRHGRSQLSIFSSFAPYDLAPDEGHYWDWSRHLDWSYYSKGPLIAWIIRAGCEVFGPTAVDTDGTLMPARCAASRPVCGADCLRACTC